MTKRKILLGLTYYLPNISGVTQYAVILAEELVKRNYEVGVICSGEKREVNRVKVYGIQGKAIGKGFIMPSYWWKSLLIVQKYEVINCHLPSIESFWLALWGKLLGKKVIVTHHCEFNFTGTIGNKVISWISYPIHFFVYLMADKIVSYTKDYADTSIFLRHFKSKIYFILPPIKIKRNEKLENRNLNKTKIVGFVGRIAWEKGLNHLIEAMEQIDAKLMLVGPYKNVAGDETYKQLSNVELVGPIEHDKLNKYYAQFDCLVLPSTNNLETFGIVQAEAMKCGCPVVASNLPGVRVPVRLTGMGMICKIADSDDLATKIKKVLKKGRKYYQRIANNLEQFDYQKTVDKYEEVFE